MEYNFSDGRTISSDGDNYVLTISLHHISTNRSLDIYIYIYTHCIYIIYIYIYIYNYIYQSEGILERINEPPWGRCLQGVVDARWVVVV